MFLDDMPQDGAMQQDAVAPAGDETNMDGSAAPAADETPAAEDASEETPVV